MSYNWITYFCPLNHIFSWRKRSAYSPLIQREESSQILQGFLDISRGSSISDLWKTSHWVKSVGGVLGFMEGLHSNSRRSPAALSHRIKYYVPENLIEDGLFVILGRKYETVSFLFFVIGYITARSQVRRRLSFFFLNWGRLKTAYHLFIYPVLCPVEIFYEHTSILTDKCKLEALLNWREILHKTTRH